MLAFIHRFLFLALAVLFLTACSPDKPQFNAIDITGADYAKAQEDIYAIAQKNNMTQAIGFHGYFPLLTLGSLPALTCSTRRRISLPPPPGQINSPIA